MVALTFRYEREVPIRRATCGGMDSEFSHFEVQETTTTVVVPEDDGDTGFWYLTARAYVDRYAGNSRDPKFRYTAPVMRTPVTAVIGVTVIARG